MVQLISRPTWNLPKTKHDEVAVNMLEAVNNKA